MLNELIARLEKAEGPDRGIDALIYCATQEPPNFGFATIIWADGDNIFWRGGTVTQGPLYLKGEGYPRYTASLDAALTLAPKGMRWKAGLDSSESDPSGKVLGYAAIRSARIYEAATPAIALCIAALKTRILETT